MASEAGRRRKVRSSGRWGLPLEGALDSSTDHTAAPSSPGGGPHPGYPSTGEPPRRRDARGGALLRQQLQDLSQELDLSPALAGPRLLDQLQQGGGGSGAGGGAFGAAVRPLQRTYLYDPITSEAGGAAPAAALAGDGGAAAVDACMRAYRDAGPGASWQASKVGKFVVEGGAAEAAAAERAPRERGPQHEPERRSRASVH